MNRLGFTAILSLALLALFVTQVTGKSAASIDLSTSTINAASYMEIIWSPTSSSAYEESKSHFLMASYFSVAKFIVTIPAHLGFTYSSASPTAAEKNLGSSNNAFFDRSPVVALSTNSDGDLLITVTNLRTGSPH